LCYQQIIFPLPSFDEGGLELLSMYNSTISELGAADSSYLDMQKRQHAVCGGINAFSSIRGGVTTPDAISAYYVYSGKALSHNLAGMNSVKSDILKSARFDETSRMREIAAQIRIGMEQSITGNGHGLAMAAAASSLSMPAYLNHKLGGLEAIKKIKALDESLNSADGLETYAQKLSRIHEKITQQAAELLLIGERDKIESWSALPDGLNAGPASSSGFSLSLAKAKNAANQAWLCNSQVNFCAQAFASVPMGHEDSAALVILSNYLRNGFLHRAVREQGGAYGGGASQDNNAGVFRFYSYRDPRMGATFDDFSASVQWMLNQKPDPEKLEEAILGTIGSIDRSESPAGQAKRCFYADLHGRTLEMRDKYRQQVLNTTHDDLIRVAETYLKPELANSAVVTGKSGIKEAETLGMKIFEL